MTVAAHRFLAVKVMVSFMAGALFVDVPELKRQFDIPMARYVLRE